MNRPAKHVARLCLGALTAAVVAIHPAGAAPEAKAGGSDIFDQLADEVAAKVLADPLFLAKTDGGRKVKIVIGDVTNDSDDEGVRVEDLFNDIRNQIVSAGTTRLFAPGELNVDFVISPELTSSVRPDDRGRRRRCFVLNLTVNKPSGELVFAQNAKRCI